MLRMMVKPQALNHGTAGRQAGHADWRISAGACGPNSIECLVVDLGSIGLGDLPTLLRLGAMSKGYAKCYISARIDAKELEPLIANKPWVKMQGLRHKNDGKNHLNLTAVSLTMHSPFERKHQDGSSVKGAECCFEVGVTDLQANNKRKVATYHIYVTAQTRWEGIWHENWQNECDFILEQICEKVQK